MSLLNWNAEFRFRSGSRRFVPALRNFRQVLEYASPLAFWDFCAERARSKLNLYRNRVSHFQSGRGLPHSTTLARLQGTNAFWQVLAHTSFLGFFFLFTTTIFSPAAETIRIAEYNLENYLDVAVGTRPAKNPAAKAKIRENILALRPDVIALVEMGSTNALMELRDSLRKQGLDLPHWDLVKGYDTNIHVALLSRLPILARRPHTNDSYLLYGRRYQMSRGVLEVDLQAGNNYRFTLMAGHLKSQRQVPEGDESEMREQEARILREKIDARLAANPNLNLVVLGDFNDTKESRSLRTILGRANTRNGLVDTRPAERNGDNLPASNPRYDPRNITWTHFYGLEDSYSRIDYILLSKGMAAEWVPAETYVLTAPNWGLASDHRPLVATFVVRDQ